MTNDVLVIEGGTVVTMDGTGQHGREHADEIGRAHV